MRCYGSTHQRGILLQILGVGVLVACGGPSHSTIRPPNPSDVVPFEIRVWADQKEYRIGEPLALMVIASADAYVTLIGTDANGESHILFPNEFGSENFLAGGRRYRIPAQNAEYRFSVEGPPGTGQIRAVATRRPGLGVDQLLNSRDSPLGEGSTEITIIDDDRDGSRTLRERGIRPKRPEKPIDIIGVPGNQPSLVQGQDEQRQPPVLPR